MTVGMLYILTTLSAELTTWQKRHMPKSMRFPIALFFFKFFSPKCWAPESAGAPYCRLYFSFPSKERNTTHNARKYVPIHASATKQQPLNGYAIHHLNMQCSVLHEGMETRFSSNSKS